MDERRIKLSKYRFDKAKESLNSASYLYEKKLFNSAMSDAYYAIFHSVRILFAFEGIDSKTHKGVVHLFNSRFIKTDLLPRELNAFLSSAFEMRLDSDYEDFYLLNKEEVKEQIENAEFFLNKILEFVKKQYNVEL